MTLEPLLNAPLAVRIHVATVVPAFFIGTWLIFFSRKGRTIHRALGYVYLTLMTITAITTLFIHQLMPNSPFFGLSPIHLLIPVTLYAVIGALRSAKAHDIAGHKRAMLILYLSGLLLAG